MATVAAGLIGALTSLVGVLLGVRFNERREHHRWLRDQKLQGAVEFITASGHLYEAYQTRGKSDMPLEEHHEWRSRMQVGRSVLYLLCDATTIEFAEDLVQRLRQTTPQTDEADNAETIEALRRLVHHLRGELNADVIR